LKILNSLFSKNENAELNPIIVIPILITIGLTIRFYYFPFQIPISLDSVDYFVYAVYIIQNGNLPEGILTTNNGWSVFLSAFFYLFNQSDVFTLMNIQRCVSIAISVLTVIPMYLLCNKFFSKTLSLFGSSLFCFEPHLIQNSLLGVTEPLFIFLQVCTLNLFYSNKSYMTNLSFVFAGMASLVRYEGLVLFIPLSVVFFLRHKPDYGNLRVYLYSVGLFVASILPMAALRIQSNDIDGLSSHIIGATNVVSSATVITSQQAGVDFFHGIIQLIIYLTWIAFPLFIILLPIGVYGILKTKKMQILEFLIFIVLLSGIGLYAYGRGIQEIRYLFVILPFFCLLSSYSFYKVEKKITRKLFTIMVIVIIISAVLYVDWKKLDYEYERERFDDAKFIVENVKTVNVYEQITYLRPASLFQTWPNLFELNTDKKIMTDIKKISLANFSSIEEVMKEGENLGLTHLVVITKNSEVFLDDVFNNESKYPYLTKIYDSGSLDHKYPLKVFEIDYKKFRQLTN